MHQETLNKLHALKLKCREGSKRSVCLANERERSGSSTHFEVRTTAATDAARLAVVGRAAAVDAGRAVRTPRGRTRTYAFTRVIDRVKEWRQVDRGSVETCTPGIKDSTPIPIDNRTSLNCEEK